MEPRPELKSSNSESGFFPLKHEGSVVTLNVAAFVKVVSVHSESCRVAQDSGVILPLHVLVGVELGSIFG